MRHNKVNKTLADFVDQEPIKKMLLEVFDRAANIKKFYHVYVFDNFVLRHWWRHNTNGRQMTENCYRKRDALSYAKRIINKKRDKGYKDEADMMTRMVRDFDDEDFEQ